MARWSLVAFFCVAIAGCGGGCSGSVDEEPSTSGSAAQRTEASGGERDDEQPTPQADPGPPPEVVVTAEVDGHSRQVTPRVANHGDQTQLASAFVVERRRDDGWTAVEDVDLSLRFSCDEVAPDCVTLAPGAVFIPPPWLGMIGDAQCICEHCRRAEAGTYRFVVRSCGGGHAVAGEPFELP